MATIFQHVIPIQSALGPGVRVESAMVDLEGCSTVNLLIGITSPDGQVTWEVLSGPTANNAFVAAVKGNIGADNHQFLSLPAYLPRVIGRIRNGRGSSAYDRRDALCREALEWSVTAPLAASHQVASVPWRLQG